MRTAVMIGSFGSFFNLYQLQALFPHLEGRFGTTVVAAGWLNMAALLGMMLTAPIIGIITRKAHHSTVLFSGFLILAFFNALVAYSNNQCWLFAFRFGQGVVIPFILTSAMSMASVRSASLVPIYVAGTVVGSTFSRAYPAWSVDAVGWEAGFLISACFMLLSALVLLFVSNVDARNFRHTRENDKAAIKYLVNAFLESKMLIAYTAGFSLLFTQSAIFTTLGLMLSEAPFFWSSGEIGYIYIACLPALFFVLISRFFRRLIREAMITVLLIFLVWASLFIIGESVVSIFSGVLLFSIGTYVFQTVTGQLLSSSGTVPVRVATGVYLSFYYCGGAIGASLAAYAFSVWGWAGVLVCVAVIQALSVCLVAYLYYGLQRRGKNGYV